MIDKTLCTLCLECVRVYHVSGNKIERIKLNQKSSGRISRTDCLRNLLLLMNQAENITHEASFIN